MEDMIGYIAGTLTTLCFVPQAFKIIKHKDVSGISLSMYLTFTTGVACWLAYGIKLSNTPIIIFNSVTLILSILIVLNILKYRKNA